MNDLGTNGPDDIEGTKEWNDSDSTKHHFYEFEGGPLHNSQHGSIKKTIPLLRPCNVMPCTYTRGVTQIH